jgi:hypothetical protein
MTAPAWTVSSLIHLAAAEGSAAMPTELLMKMIFSKVGPCCETARRAAVSMPQMRQSATKTSSSAVQEGQWSRELDRLNASTVSLCNANFSGLG